MKSQLEVVLSIATEVKDNKLILKYSIQFFIDLLKTCISSQTNTYILFLQYNKRE